MLGNNDIFRENKGDIFLEDKDDIFPEDKDDIFCEEMEKGRGSTGSTAPKAGHLPTDDNNLYLKLIRKFFKP